MVESAPLVAVSTYGESGASARVRIYDWLRKTNAKADLYEYLGESDNQLPTLIRRPAKVVREELRLRRLIGELNSKTLIMSRQASPFTSGARNEAASSR